MVADVGVPLAAREYYRQKFRQPRCKYSGRACFSGQAKTFCVRNYQSDSSEAEHHSGHDSLHHSQRISSLLVKLWIIRTDRR